ncbi:MAG: PadR family transcriptional regulator [Planctomycetaceae bacterium]
MDPKQLAGTLDLLLLEVISAGPSYGYDITQQVFSRSEGTFELKEGSLYPALHRLERQKLLTSFWQEHDGRRRKYYRITAAGKKSLDQRRKSWLDFARGVNGVLGALPGDAYAMG